MTNGITIGEKGYKERLASITAGQIVYNLPDDLGTLLYLNIEGAYIKSIEGHQLVVYPVPEKTIVDAITIHYLPKGDTNAPEA